MRNGRIFEGLTRRGVRSLLCTEAEVALLGLYARRYTLLPTWFEDHPAEWVQQTFLICIHDELNTACAI